MRSYYNIDDYGGVAYIEISKLNDRQKQHINDLLKPFNEELKNEDEFFEGDNDKLYKYYLNVKIVNDNADILEKYLNSEGIVEWYKLDDDYSDENWNTYIDEDDYDEETKIKQGIGMKRYYYINDDEIWISDLEKFRIRYINKPLHVFNDEKKSKNEIIYKYNVSVGKYKESMVEYLGKNGYIEMIKMSDNYKV
jgi:hypothetical protein